METKFRFVIQHKENQQYFADTPERKTTQLWKAKRFHDDQQYQMWLSTSPYAVDPDMYDFIEVEMTIKRGGRT